MASKPLPSPELLRQVLRYDANTGKLFWLPRPVGMFASEWAWKVFCKTREWREAFTSISGHGYPHGSVFGSYVQAHRVAWAVHHGEWPRDQIDHINNDRSDNRMCNLREATNSQNHMNKPKSVANSSGHKGVSPTKCGKKWRVRVKVNGKMKQYGEFLRIEDAVARYAEVSAMLHGEFSRPV